MDATTQTTTTIKTLINKKLDNVIPQKLVDIFGDKAKALEAANLALQYGEFMQEAGMDFYWYKPINEKKDVFERFVDDYKPLNPQSKSK